jgi:hypothetical protein
MLVDKVSGRVMEGNIASPRLFSVTVIKIVRTEVMSKILAVVI